MNSIFKINISKEIFKIANLKCIKIAWILQNINNFKKAVEWNQNQEYFFNIDHDLETEDDFNSDATSINLFEEYTNLDLKTEEQKAEFLDKWVSFFNSDDGFNLDEFKGDAIEDGLEFGQKVIEYFDLKQIKDYPNKLTKDFNDTANIIDAVNQTKELLKYHQNEYIYLYEPAFEFDNFNLKVKCDVLKLNGNNHVEIIEAKATTKVKKEHFWDLVYQVYVLEKNGYIVDNIAIARLNKNYLRDYDTSLDFDLKTSIDEFVNSYQNISFKQAKDIVDNIDNLDLGFKNLDQIEDLDLNKLVEIDYFTYGQAKNRNTLFEDFNNLVNVVNLDELFLKIAYMLKKDENEIIEIFKNDSCYLNYDKKNKNWVKWTRELSDYKACCHVLKWFDQSISNFWHFGGMLQTQKAFLIRHLPSAYFKDYNSLLDSKITSLLNDQYDKFINYKYNRIFQIAKIDDQIKNDPSLMVDNNYFYILKQVFNKYETLPIYMYDFETVKFAVPRYAKINPYYQIPFQYSIDIIHNKNYDYNKPETMIHYDFLANDYQDPRKEFIINFLKNIFSNQKGVYVAYNDAFEKSVLKRIAFLFPKLAIPILYIVQNTIDLMDFFKGVKQDNSIEANFRPWFLIANKNFYGSYSIKKTQPGLDSTFTYKNLTINNGSKASETFRRFLEQRIEINVWNNLIRSDMIKYCNRDTLAMVVILKKVSEIIKIWEAKNGK
ncbi:DUF2779 domain-containing protein [Mycoplasma feriruminatoris]|uniref:DUF2779 domain-containing protein n=1 Tax=Mycoplasma feriruminatoris TaxID=1179777 RepID=UPI00241F9C0A|nr:DUF2779 domain-containing protein [Mycoplasma feriruminatoris]WFQ90223.1 hypothetical protein MFERI11561_00474 [Mycoplasma feriruminatoris]